MVRHEHSDFQISKFGQWLGVLLFAVAMAWVESAVVLYLRSLSGEFDPYRAGSAAVGGGITCAEIVRKKQRLW